MEGIMTYSVTSTEPIFDGRAFSVRIDSVRAPDGKVRKIEIVDHPGAVTLVPVDGDGRLHFVRQYRHSSLEVLLELPARTLDPHEDPQDCAARECREETGMAAKEIRRLGGFFLAPGYSTEYLHVYLATGLTESPLPADEDEDLTVERLTLDEAEELARSGKLHDAKTLAALYLYRLHGGR
jgi:ADP-ribose diphosphatase